MADEVIDIIMDQWSNPSLENRFDGPAITGFSNGATSFTFSALSGNVSTTNPTAFQCLFPFQYAD